MVDGLFRNNEIPSRFPFSPFENIFRSLDVDESTDFTAEAQRKLDR